ncbi:MAG TPA: xanthine dehydrogenase family protein subunit M [Sporichthyaceae bacterium]|jgi:carbon-monoxide dehydrogenase medium subunit|nr:xanthine dehydrogenase family protein subunit M [Sporichthyaceae bacterium]
MYPAKFRYEAPTSLAEALEMLSVYGDECKILAGGQSLVPMLKLRFASPGVLIDINNLPGLAYHRRDTNGSLRVGALCRHRDLERSALLPQHQPTMAGVAPLIADPIVRCRGTLVGSLCHSDPQGDWAAAAVACGAKVVATSARGEREIPVSEFFTGPFENALALDEIATEAVFPSAKGMQGGYLKLERRIGDFATAGVAVALEVTGDRVTRAGLALTGVGPRTLEATGAAEYLKSKSLTQSVIEEASRLSAEAAQPRGDHRGSSEYKRHIIYTFTNRLLTRLALAA